jgi:transposase
LEKVFKQGDPVVKLSMFIRKRHNSSGTTSIQIVQKIGSSIRVMKHVGTASSNEQLDQLKLKAQEFLNQSNLPLFDSASSSLENIFISKSFLIGFQEVFGNIYDEIGYSALVQNTLLKYLVISRIAKPNSKLATLRWLNEKLGKSIEKDQIYRFMDTLDDNMERVITDHTFAFTRKILNEPINIIFFDATTLHFETFKSDKFRKPGFSKVGKHNQPQIVIGLMVSKGGFPIGYDVYPGNEFDGHTIRSALKRVSRRYSVEDVVFIADNAMMSTANVKIIEQSKFKFIMAARIKSMSNFYKDQILDQSNYKKNIFDLDYGKHRLVVSYSADRARKDRTDREKNLEQIKKRLTKRSKITKSKLGKIGKSKYLSIDGEAEVAINYLAVEADEVWDGLKGYMTNMSKEEISSEEVINRYSDLWQIERAFKVSKNDLQIRPIYHFKRERIRAHVLIVFISLVISRFAELKLKDKGITIRRLVEILENDNLIEIINPKTGEKVLRRTPLPDILKEIYSILKINW